MKDNKNKPQDNKQIEYNTYLDERKSLVNTELEISARFDKGILTLSGGALLLSMTFVKDIADKPNLNCMLLIWFLQKVIYTTNWDNN